MEEFADKVAKLCIEKYVALGKTGKPSEKEWTVLSGVILKKADSQLVLVALATGTKCLGESDLLNTKLYDVGSRLSDSHAEVLARRAFLRYLYEQIDLLFSSRESDIFVLNDKKRIMIRHGVSFHFFSSQTPCGDCSIFLKENGDENEAPPVKIRKCENGDEGKKVSESSTNDEVAQVLKDIYRTGAKCVKTEESQDPHLPGVNYHVVGPLRTKPGRGSPTLSLSCSDKMAKWNILGLQGSLLSTLIPPIRIQTLIIGADCPFSNDAMERGLYKRFGKDEDTLKIVQARIGFPHMKRQERRSPCSSSIIWCAVKKRNIEIAVEGRKQGATKKKKGSDLLVSRRALFETFLRTFDKSHDQISDVLHPKKITYLDCKKSAADYQNSWDRLKSEAFRAWPSKPSYLQGFVL